MTKQGKTTGNLKLRSGPGMQYDPPIGYLVPDTALEILGEEGEWWKVRVEGKEGYVGKKYVAVTETPVDTSANTKPADDTAKGRKSMVTARPMGKPGPAKGIRADADAVEPKTAPKPSAPKSTTVRTTVKPSAAPKPKGPPTGSKKI
jgi:uncharacterized protein YgiM (DUF1202 family)